MGQTTLWKKKGRKSVSIEHRKSNSERPSSPMSMALVSTNSQPLCIWALGPQSCASLSVSYVGWGPVSEDLTIYCLSFSNEQILDKGEE